MSRDFVYFPDWAGNLFAVRLDTGCAARLLHALGPRHVLVKGGHLRGDTDICVDLHYDGHSFTELPGPRFTTGNTHGGGDSMASALASGLARRTFGETSNENPAWLPRPR